DPIFKKLVLEIWIQDDFVFKTSDINVNQQPRRGIVQTHVVRLGQICRDQFVTIDVFIEGKRNFIPYIVHTVRWLWNAHQTRRLPIYSTFDSLGETRFLAGISSADGPGMNLVGTIRRPRRFPEKLRETCP